MDKQPDDIIDFLNGMMSKRAKAHKHIKAVDDFAKLASQMQAAVDRLNKPKEGRTNGNP